MQKKLLLVLFIGCLFNRLNAQVFTVTGGTPNTITLGAVHLTPTCGVSPWLTVGSTGGFLDNTVAVTITSNIPIYCMNIPCASLTASNITTEAHRFDAIGVVETVTVPSGCGYYVTNGNEVRSTLNTINTSSGVVSVSSLTPFTQVSVLMISPYATVVSPASFITGCAVPLGVSLTSFNATEIADNRQVLLSWTTDEEIKNDHFEVEHSTNGTTWEVIGKVNGHGNSTSVNDYDFIHVNAAQNKNNYYRLKQVDFDGVYNYSAIEAIIFDYTEVDWLVVQNSTNNSISLLGKNVEDFEFAAYDMQGRIVNCSIIERSQGVVTIDKTNIQSDLICLIGTRENEIKKVKVFIEK